MQQAAATYLKEKIGRILIESRVNDAALAGLKNRTEGVELDINVYQWLLGLTDEDIREMAALASCQPG